MTQQRRAILRVMEMATKHLDAANLLRKAQKLDASATCGHAATRCRRVLLESLGWYGTYFYESEMALISEWMEQCGKKAKTKRKKVLDNAGIVRDAMFR